MANLLMSEDGSEQADNHTERNRYGLIVTRQLNYTKQLQ